MDMDPQVAALFGIGATPDTSAPAAAPAAATPDTDAAPPAKAGSIVDPQIAQLFGMGAPQTVAADAAATPPASSAPPSANAPSSGPRLGPWTSAVVRPIYKAVTSIPMMAADAGVAARNIGGDALNKALGRPATPDYDLPSTMIDEDLDGVTTPPQGVGKLAEFLSTAILSGKTAMPKGLTTADAQALAKVPTGFVPGISDRPNLPPPATSGGLTGAQQAAATQGKALGFKLTPGTASGSVPLQQLEARLASKPATSGPFAAIKANNQTVLNRAAAQSIGENSDVVDSTVLGRANDRLGQTFEDIRDPNSILATDPQETSGVLDQIDQDSSGLLPDNMSIRDNPLVKQFEGLTSSGGINGQQLGQLSSKLGKAAFNQMTSPHGDRNLGEALYNVKNHADDLLQSTLSPDDAADYADARNQYRNLMHLTSRPNIVNPSTGNVSGVALANRLQQADESGFLYGNNQTPLYAAARFAQAFKPLVGDSGTATRSGGNGGVLAGFGLGELARAGGLPASAQIAAMAAPVAARVGANLATRAYLTRPGAGLAQALLSAPKLAGQAATLPWRAMAPGALAASPSRLRLLAPLGNPTVLSLGRPAVPMLPAPTPGQ